MHWLPIIAERAPRLPHDFLTTSPRLAQRRHKLLDSGQLPIDYRLFVAVFDVEWLFGGPRQSSTSGGAAMARRLVEIGGGIPGGVAGLRCGLAAADSAGAGLCEAKGWRPGRAGHEAWESTPGPLGGASVIGRSGEMAAPELDAGGAIERADQSAERGALFGWPRSC